MSKTQPSHERAVLDVIERFRECQNLIPTVIQHLRAMENMARQRGCLEGASRRHQQTCSHSLPSPTPRRRGEGEKKEVVNQNGERVNPKGESAFSHSKAWIDGVIPPVVACAPPLGVLSAFPVAVVELLVGDQQRTQERLLKAISDTMQTWQRKVVACRQGLERIEGASPPHMDDCARRRGLGSRAQLCIGTYGLLAALIKMESVLQESVLALRRDLHRGEGHSPAAALSQLLQRESNEADAPPRPATGLEVGQESVENVSYELYASTYSLLEALEKLPELVRKMWEHSKRVYCTEESLILLASCS
ncbi:unnamed protein product [Phytomonas sp. EM1]|nr:unnamed protein product [Phytomonas sp. EM1]|eukprot:CCW63153.1 unnamed protein product [Phytomonas sp. isolate EM1]